MRISFLPNNSPHFLNDMGNCCFSGKTFCINQIEDLSKDSAFVGSSEQVHNIIMFLHRLGGLVKHVDSFMQMLTSLEPKERTPFVLAPLCSLDLPEVKVLRFVISLL